MTCHSSRFNIPEYAHIVLITTIDIALYKIQVFPCEMFPTICFSILELSIVTLLTAVYLC